MDRDSARNVIESALTQRFAEDRFRHLAINLLEGIDEGKAFNWVSGNYIRDAFKDHVRKYRRLGTYTDPGGRKLDLLIVHLKNPWALERSRATQRNFVAEYLKQRGEKDAALIAYHVDDLADWRFSFVRMQYREELTDDGRVKVKEEFTPSRRYSFLVGESEPSHTAQQQLVPLLEDIETPTLDEIERTFSVERVTKEFYTDYRGLFEKVCKALEAVVEKSRRVQEEFARQSIDAANFAKKLLGQIVFLYFLQKKGWLGVGRDEAGDFKPWGQGPKNFLRKLYEREFVDYTNFFDDVLEPLFYNALASEHDDDYYHELKCRIPFLNGGLFEPLNDYNWQEVDIHLPNDLIGEVVETFDQYNFTVREDDPLDQEVAVDPEMLGKVFENLLPENLRKGAGSYYTPRNVVHFMCQESLINYLDGAVNRGDVPLVSSHKQQQLIATGEAQQIELQGEGRSLQIPREDLEEFIRRGEFAQEMDLAKAGGPLSYKPEGTKSYEYRVPESIRGHAKAIDRALADLKICDPAVGSGAFLVGMMHEVVKARSILTTYLDAPSERSPYELKRQCIHNSLYGVDIDPGAVDIAKLRLWLSLVVDEEDYKSIHPLPNLDYKVMQGNSLFEDFHGITLSVEDEGVAGSLLRRDAKLVERIEQLHQTQVEYFDAKHPGEKKTLRAAVEDAILDVFTYEIERQNHAYYEAKAQIERTAQGISEPQREQYVSEELAKLTARFELNPQELERELRELTHGNVPRDFFPWRLYFADVFRSKGGFDVVIANPPYVRQERITVQKPRLKTAYPDVYHGVADIYVYFYRKAFDMAAQGGIVTFISSNKYFRAGYGKTLRTYLREKAAVLLVVDFGDLPVFDATTYPCVVIAAQGSADLKRHTVRVANVHDMQILDTLAEYILEDGWEQPQRSLLKDGWVFERKDVLALVEKLRQSGTPLGAYVSGGFYRGIVTGCNEAFVIDQATRERLIEEDSRSAEIIKPWLRGKDVKRWMVKWQGLYLIYSEWDLQINRYPAVYDHLTQYRAKLEARPEVQEGRFPWYSLSRYASEYAGDFERSAIIYQEIATLQAFGFTSEPFFLNNKCFMIPMDDMYLLGILNSRAAWFFLKHTASKLQGGAYAMQSPYVSQVPVPEAESDLRQIIESRAASLATGESESPAKLEAELEDAVRTAFGLSSTEVALIDKSLSAQATHRRTNG